MPVTCILGTSEPFVSHLDPAARARVVLPTFRWPPKLCQGLLCSLRRPGIPPSFQSCSVVDYTQMLNQPYKCLSLPSCHRQTLASVQEETGSICQCMSHRGTGNEEPPSPAQLRESILEHNLSKNERRGGGDSKGLEAAGPLLQNKDPDQDLRLNKGEN